MSSALSSQLLTSCRTHQAVRTALLRDFPGLDDETLADTLEGLTDLHDMLCALLQSTLDDQTLLQGLTARLADMKARHARLSTRIDKKRALVLACMRDASIARLTQPDYSAFVGKARPSLVILSESEIPSPFWKPQAPVLDRHALVMALKRGEGVAGAALSTAGLQLSVRTR